MSVQPSFALLSSTFGQNTDIVQQEALSVAWNCAYWISILFNWNGNKFDLELSRQGRMSLIGAKKLILELTYSIAHRIQELLSRVCRIAIKLENNPGEHSPVVVFCALWVIFAGTRKFETHSPEFGA